MITWLKEYIVTVIAIAIISLILESLLPEGNVKKYAAYAFSIILSISMIQPLLQIKGDINIPEINVSNTSIDYLTAVKTTVNGIIGYEDAEVTVKQNDDKIESITIKTGDKKIIEDAIAKITEDDVKEIIYAIYGVDKEKIHISE